MDQLEHRGTSNSILKLLSDELSRISVRFDNGVNHFAEHCDRSLTRVKSAISTVMFADVELDRVSFGFGVVSLLSSLISIGFGTGLMYVLGDVNGRTLGVSDPKTKPLDPQANYAFRKSANVTQSCLYSHSPSHKYARHPSLDFNPDLSLDIRSGQASASSLSSFAPVYSRGMPLTKDGPPRSANVLPLSSL